MNKKRTIQQAILAGCLLVAVCAIFFLGRKSGEMTLINEADESLVKITVVINHQTFDFADIPPGATRQIKFKMERDNHYAVSVEFHYERTLELQTGYFTDREPDHQLVVKHDQVVLEAGEN